MLIWSARILRIFLSYGKMPTSRHELSMPRTLSGAASAASISSHGDRLLVLLDVLEELDGAVELPAVDGLRRLAGVLVRDTEVGAPSAGALAVVDGSCCVPDHRCGDV